MEQMLSFVLGTVCALGLVGLGYTFVSVLKMRKQIENLNEEKRGIHQGIDENHKYVDSQCENLDRHTNQRMDDICNEIDKRSDDICNEIDKRSEDIYGRIDELNRYVDSRFDKQMDRLADELHSHSSRIAELETDKKVKEDRIENYDQLNS